MLSNLLSATTKNSSNKVISQMLLSLLEGLLKHTVALCDRNKIDLRSIPIFDLSLNKCQTDLVTVYQNLCQ